MEYDLKCHTGWVATKVDILFCDSSTFSSHSRTGSDLALVSVIARWRQGSSNKTQSQKMECHRLGSVNHGQGGKEQKKAGSSSAASGLQRVAAQKL